MVFKSRTPPRVVGDTCASGREIAFAADGGNGGLAISSTAWGVIRPMPGDTEAFGRDWVCHHRIAEVRTRAYHRPTFDTERPELTRDR